MEAEVGRDVNVLRDARKASLMTQGEIAQCLGTSKQTIVAWEKVPEKLSLETLSKYYSIVGTDARECIKEFVMSFFVD